MKKLGFSITCLIIVSLFSLTPLYFCTETVSAILDSNNGPDPRFGHKIEFNPTQEQLLLFGGETKIDGEYLQFNDTWIFSCNNNSWNIVSSPDYPSGRHNYGLSFNPDENRCLLFGGFDNYDILNDSWLFNWYTYEWEIINSTSSPSPRSDAAMCYDSVNEKTILFGGYDFDGEFSLNDTWIFHWNNNSWSEVHPLSTPDSRYGHQIVFDSENQNVVLFGGRAGQVTNDVWVYGYEDNSWTEILQDEPPDEIYGHSMAYDSQNSKIIVFGGRHSYYLTTDVFNQTWAYDQSLNEWEQMNPETYPSERVLTSMTYDSVNNRTFLFGGFGDIPIEESGIFNDLWTYDYEDNEWTLIGQDSPISFTGIELILISLGVLVLVVIILKSRRK